MRKPSRVLVLADRKTLLAHTLLRVVVGGIMAAHGFQKLLDPAQFQHHLTSMGFPVPGLMTYLAIAGELLGGLGLVVGLLTPIAAFGVASTLLVAVIVVHLKHGLFAANGGFEYPLMLVCTALWFMSAGAGPYSLDAVWRAARDKSPGQGLPMERAVSPMRPGETPSEHDVITEAGHESFPASDPPAHSRHQH
ncbi:MAG TPA: DoxX family protein [Polyangiales bacterium]|nr:DoxX family protein [Polyangiales bacterium]